MGDKRVLLCTDRRAIIGLLRRTHGLQVVGCLGTRVAVPFAARRLAPDIVLIDRDRAPAELALERLRETEQRLTSAQRVLLSRQMDAAWLDAAFAAGADAVISDDVRPAHLGVVVLELAHDHIVRPPRRGARVRTHTTPPLSPRELEILRLVARGWSNRQIATRLHVVEQTVKYHLSNAYRKLGVANRTEATHYAHQHGLLSQDALRQAASARGFGISAAPRVRSNNS